MTQEELAAETLLPTRTVRCAVTQPEERGLATSRISFEDARKQLHSLDESQFAVREPASLSR